MHCNAERAHKALELADWLRTVEGEDVGALMARAAVALEWIAAEAAEDDDEDDDLDVVPEIAPFEFAMAPIALPRARNDNRLALRRRTRH